MISAADHAFVICAYKENPYLENTINSLLQQSVFSRVGVSTSTPNDHIIKVCEKYNLELFINPNPGLAGDDWNFALSRFDVPFVTLAHQDDIYEASFLKRVLEEMGRYDKEDISLAFTDYYELRPEGKVEANSLLRIKRCMNYPLSWKLCNGLALVKRRILSFGCSICCPSVTINKKVVGENVFNTSYVNSCDYKTWVELAGEPGRFVYIPDQLMGHRIYSESATSVNLSENIRKKEDLEILFSLWPKSVARFINHVYSKSEKSNNI